MVIWFTGLSGAGKTTLAEKIAERIGKRAVVLDGDGLRKFFTGLKFDKRSRSQHGRNIARFAAYLEDRGFIPIVSLISPYRQDRQYAREIADKFVEVYVSTPLEICRARDPKGLYEKAKRREIRNLTGEQAPYEPPEGPEVAINTTHQSIEACVGEIWDVLDL